ncbi:MAG: class I SAM-dependent methyltransferase [Deltaproteobacteria bacterium]|nr:class I SAM-dependent methyltransferase [Deltaproteobacteria bacterium]
MSHDSNTLTVAVCPATPEQKDGANSLAEKLGIPLAQIDSREFEFLLICSDDGLALKQTGPRTPLPVAAGFTDPKMEYRLKHGGGRRQALSRAVGLKKNLHPTVSDATGGLGRDAFILAHLGCQVHILERSPILAAMLEDGLQRAGRKSKTAETAARILFTCIDSKVFLRRLNEQKRPEVIYLDPMYPERTKSSLVKKEMRMLRRLAGNDRDAAELLDIALHCTRNSVVVKRPRLAPPLGNKTPSHSIKGRSSRFDVYLV